MLVIKATTYLSEDHFKCPLCGPTPSLTLQRWGWRVLILLKSRNPKRHFCSLKIDQVIYDPRFMSFTLNKTLLFGSAEQALPTPVPHPPHWRMPLYTAWYTHPQGPGGVGSYFLFWNPRRMGSFYPTPGPTPTLLFVPLSSHPGKYLTRQKFLAR
jgi:hypothetical protein